MDDLIAAGAGQRPLFDARDRERSDRLMSALNAVNGKFGRGTLAPAAVGIRREWQTKFEMRSPRYTTRVGELPRVGASVERHQEFLHMLATSGPRGHVVRHMLG